MMTPDLEMDFNSRPQTFQMNYLLRDLCYSQVRRIVNHSEYQASILGWPPSLNSGRSQQRQLLRVASIEPNQTCPDVDHV